MTSVVACSTRPAQRTALQQRGPERARRASDGSRTKCDGTPGQTFTYGFPDKQLRADGLCMNMEGNSTTDSTPIETDTCDTTASQRWSFFGIQIRGYGETCLDRPHNDLAPGTQTQIYGCNGSDAQEWAIMSDGSIRSGDAGDGSKCLAVPGAAPSNGTRLEMANCTQSSDQKFRLDFDGHIRFADKCVEVRGPSWENGTAVQIANCSSAIHQKWHLTGPIHDVGHCMDLKKNMPNPLQPIQIYGCNGTDAQKWDYYFTPYPFVLGPIEAFPIGGTR